jgi:hypothetical protein
VEMELIFSPHPQLDVGHHPRQLTGWWDLSLCLCDRSRLHLHVHASYQPD